MTIVHKFHSHDFYEPAMIAFFRWTYRQIDIAISYFHSKPPLCILCAPREIVTRNFLAWPMSIKQWVSSCITKTFII